MPAVLESIANLGGAPAFRMSLEQQVQQLFHQLAILLEESVETFA